MERFIEFNNELNIPKDGRIQLNKDKEAVRAYYEDHVNINYRSYQDFEEKLNYLIDNGFIDEKVTTDLYSFLFIEKLSKMLYGKKFRFKSFMGAYKAHKQYVMMDTKTNKYVETFEDRILWNALMMGNGDEELAEKFAIELINSRIQPATPTFLNAGRKQRGELVSCFLIDIEDNMDSIGRAVNSALQLSRIGGGVGVNLSNLRESGARIKNTEGAGSGVVPVMKLFEDSFLYSNQLGQRAGAGVVYLSIFHPDVMDFLSTRKENAESSKQIKNLSIALTVPDKFYELLENNSVMHLFSVYDVEREYGIPYSYVDITEEYENMVNNPRISKKTIKASVLNDEIGKLQQESGYPYIMNIDTVNKANPIDGKIIMSNLCSEILQVQEPSKIRGDQTYEHLGKDISCNLASLNLPNFLKEENKDNVENTVETAIRGLSFVSDSSKIETVPTIERGNRESHAVGLGAMGLHQLFAINEIDYGSKESVELTDRLFEMINFFTLKASNKIAIERKETFVGFERSKYADGTYFDTYIEEGDKEFKYEKAAKVLEGFPVPTVSDWKELKESVMKHGIYNQNRMAVAPNGSISYVNETTASLHPITSLVEKRQEAKVGSVYYPAPDLSDKTIPYYKSAYSISMFKQIDVYAAAQKHIDQGMSLTVFMNSEIPEGMYPWKPEGGSMTTRELTLIRHYAWKKGIKTLYYVRTFTQDGNEVGINECESCQV